MAKRNFKSKNRNNYKRDTKYNNNNVDNRRKGTARFEEDEREYSRKGSNDPAWYATDPTLIRDAASIPFSWAVGTPFDTGVGSKVNNTVTTTKYTVPGVCALALLPTYGKAEDSSSPINVAATATYSFIRHANSGHANYDSPDLMCYLMAMSSVYSYIVSLQRIYGTATLYTQRNRYVPRALLSAMGAECDDVFQNLAQLRYGINLLVAKASSLAVPGDFTIYQRQAFLYQNLYSEGTSVKDQIYLYVPAAFVQFSPVVKQSSGLIYKPWWSWNIPSASTPNYKVKDLIAFGESLLAPLINDEDCNIMSGDILKAYGVDKIVKLSQIPEDFTAEIVFNIGVLEQMKNATILNVSPARDTVDGEANVPLALYQDSTKAYLQSGLRTMALGAGTATTGAAALQEYAARAWCGNKVLTTTTAEVTPELIMESTRLMASATPATSGTIYSNMKIACGSEICTACLIFSDAVSELQPVVSERADYPVIGMTHTAGSEAYTIISSGVKLGAISDFTMFRFHPELQMWAFVVGSGGISQADFFGYYYDIDNYAILTPAEIERMHEAALVNMLHVPSVASIRTTSAK